MKITMSNPDVTISCPLGEGNTIIYRIDNVKQKDFSKEDLSDLAFDTAVEISGALKHINGWKRIQTVDVVDDNGTLVVEWKRGEQVC